MEAMPEWEQVQDQNTTGLSERWRKRRDEHEFRIFYDKDHVEYEPEEIHGLCWILVVLDTSDPRAPRYVYWSALSTEDFAKTVADSLLL